MKLHDLRPAPGAHTPKRRVGRGIAAGQGKTAGRGTKGQKARAGGSIPAWFEGGQTPLHQRLPKLHGFRNPFRIEYEIVNVGDIAALVERGVLEPGEMPARASKRAAGKAGSEKAAGPVTVNQEILRASGLVRTLDRPLKILGAGELSAPLYVLADAFSASARAKIEAAGGTASVLESELTKRGRPAPAEEPTAGADSTPEASADVPSKPAAVAAEETVASATAPSELLEAKAASDAGTVSESPTLAAKGRKASTPRAARAVPAGDDESAPTAPGARASALATTAGAAPADGGPALAKPARRRKATAAEPSGDDAAAPAGDEPSGHEPSGDESSAG